MSAIKMDKNTNTKNTTCIQINLWSFYNNTVMILSFWRDRSGQTVQTQIRLFLEEQSDQGLHCLQFQLHLLGALAFGKAFLFKF